MNTGAVHNVYMTCTAIHPTDEVTCVVNVNFRNAVANAIADTPATMARTGRTEFIPVPLNVP